ncbi:DUF4405 domain-containing protein [Desulfotalea psychrophila]|uniref:Flavinylation-associated cytochrome domain-containing protein n=1 Tax=Desulfotalea psychrophila (strain LSv54 / DSM 12343) TaxID=177439 RepID=Q6APY0_DESPS|nr:DUF4405 domain-containing protein [Desulfotalea psychrophila]CAG35593.1 unknown protein [Desulfotalea psychrophila LSv54]
MRQIVSLLLLVSGIMEVFTSVVLYIVPAGRVAYWSGYRFLWLSKEQWGDMHITLGVLFLLAAVLHCFVNIRSIVNYFRNKARKFSFFNTKFLIALILSLYVAIGTLYRLTPMNYVLTWGEEFSQTANQKYGEPPYGHAEMSSLTMFCKRMNLDLDRASELLTANGIQFAGPATPISEIAVENGRIPQDIYQIIRSAKAQPKVRQNGQGQISAKVTPIFPDLPPAGFGNMTIGSICQQYEVLPSHLLAELQNRGLLIDEMDTVKEVGVKNNTSPMTVFELIHEVLVPPAPATKI